MDEYTLYQTSFRIRADQRDTLWCLQRISGLNRSAIVRRLIDEEARRNAAALEKLEAAREAAQAELVAAEGESGR
jgi:hypothetical protein